jgi:DNA-binding Xre family transcriptional regulator
LRTLQIEVDTSGAREHHGLGISHPTYTRLENANQNVTLKTLTELCRALDCDMGALFSCDVRLRRRARRS